MEIMFLLIPLSVVLVFLIGIAFWWSLRTGQYDDLEGPAYRVLMDQDKPEVTPEVTIEPEIIEPNRESGRPRPDSKAG